MTTETIDFDTMTDPEISALATRCLDSLTLATRVQAVLSGFHNSEDRQELITWLQDAEGEDPEPEETEE